MKMLSKYFLLILAVILLPLAANAQTPTAPFILIGYIQTFTLCPAGITPCATSDPLAAASMKVNGVTIIIPANLIIQMPGSYLTAQDIFKGPQGSAIGTALANSGIAMDDPRPAGAFFAPYTAEITGNIVGNQFIAGLVTIGQVPLQSTSGYIKSIDYAKAELLVGPKDSNPAVSTRVRLNDPTVAGLGKGRFSAGQSPDFRFRADQDFPTVHAVTGYPICIPRTDPQVADDSLCPKRNRSLGPTVTRYTLGTVAALPDAPACSACDPREMVPLQIGDYVTYSGILAMDGTQSYISAYMLEVDLGLFTSPGANPAYLTQEVTLIGTGGIPFPGLDQETGPGKTIPGSTVVTRFKIVGFTTDPSRNVDVMALDVKSNGAETGRLLVSLRPSVKAPIGRFERVIDRSIFLPPTREIRTQITGLPMPKFAIANKLDWGVYDAPVAEFLFPEGRVFGNKPVPANFENLCYLFAGSGPLGTMGRGENGVPPGPSVLKLSPFPDSGHANGETACP